MDIIKSSISDIIAGLVLLIVSILVFLEMFNVLRSPLFNGALGIMFLYLALLNPNTRRYYHDRHCFLNIDLNSIIIGIFLLIISFSGAAGHFGLIQHVLFPLIPGLLLILVAVFKIYIKTTRPDVIIYRIDPCQIVGGEALVFYSILLYMDLTSLAWSPVFPLLVAGALYTVLFIDLFPQLKSQHAGIIEATTWLNEIEDKISIVKSEFESLKLTRDENRLSANLERLDAILKRLTQLNEIIAAQLTFASQQGNLTNTNPGIPEQITKPGVKTAWSAPEKALGSEINAAGLDALMGPASDDVFYENLQQELDRAGLSEIIKEAREIRNSIISNRKKGG